jgi:hypothetical protein
MGNKDRIKRWVVANITHREMRDLHRIIIASVRRTGSKSVLDVAPPKSFDIRPHIGGATYTGIGLHSRFLKDIEHDLEKNPYPVKTKSHDMVIMSNILEHLHDPTGAMKEAIRISRKWILISLPNELDIQNRIGILFGRPRGNDDLKFLFEYGHKYFLTPKNMRYFIETHCGLDANLMERHYCYGMSAGKYIPRSMRFGLARTMPSIFAHSHLFLYKLK